MCDGGAIRCEQPLSAFVRINKKDDVELGGGHQSR